MECKLRWRRSQRSTRECGERESTKEHARLIFPQDEIPKQLTSQGFYPECWRFSETSQLRLPSWTQHQVDFPGGWRPSRWSCCKYPLFLANLRLHNKTFNNSFISRGENTIFLFAVSNGSINIDYAMTFDSKVDRWAAKSQTLVFVMRERKMRVSYILNYKQSKLTALW